MDTKIDLKLVTKKHLKYLKGEKGGERANLSGSDLSYSDLSYSDLRGANLSYLTGNLREVRSLHIESHIVVYVSDRFWVDCKNGIIGKWKEFESILNNGELKQWKKHRAFIKSVIKKYPATPTGKE
jgi:hypothetical protein